MNSPPDPKALGVCGLQRAGTEFWDVGATVDSPSESESLASESNSGANPHPAPSTNRTPPAPVLQLAGSCEQLARAGS